MSTSESLWRQPRNVKAAAIQLARRQAWPDLPFIHGEIQTRMLERSEIMRPADGCVLDMSLGRLDVAQSLAARFAERAVHVVRWREPGRAAAAPGWLQRQLQRFSGGHRAPAPQVAGEVVLMDERAALVGLPPVGLVWSNGLLHRLSDPAAVLRQWQSALVPGGALFFSCLGPDSARELGQAAGALGEPFADFADMHDWGDLLVKTGFSDPVMEMERLVLTYRRVEDLLRDWRCLGGNAAMVSGSGLRSRAYAGRLHNILQNLEGGSLQISLEILYGHAWKVERSSKPSEFRIPVSEIRRKS